MTCQAEKWLHVHLEGKEDGAGGREKDGESISSSESLFCLLLQSFFFTYPIINKIMHAKWVNLNRAFTFPVYIFITNNPLVIGYN